MAQQLIARRVATGVIDQLELVQVEEHQGMVPRLLAPDAMQRLLQAVFKLASVGKPGQGIMGRLPGQIGNVLALLGHVVQHQHRPADFAGTADRRADQGHGHGAAIQALDQLGMLAATAELATQNMVDQGKPIGLGVFIQQIEQCGQGQALGLGGAPVGQGFRRRVHIGDRAIDIGGDHSVADGLQGDLCPLLLQLQGIGKRMALGQ